MPDNITSAIIKGGKETLYNPPLSECSDQIHEPFRLRDIPAQLENDDEIFLWGIVETRGIQFSGDRTDIHDVLSLIWAAFIRAFGLGSPWLIDEDHFIGPQELGARHLIIQQCPWELSQETDFNAAYKAMNAWTAFGFHLLDSVFRWSRSIQKNRIDHPSTYNIKLPAWAEAVTKHMNSPDDIKFNYRTFPLWLYCSSLSEGITIIQMPRKRMENLKRILVPFHPSICKGETAIALFANGIPNAVPNKVIDRSSKIFEIVDDDCVAPIMLPIDSHCLFIGNKTIIAIRENCGREIYELERKALLKRRQSEDKVFFANSSVEWILPLQAGDFEDLCIEIIRREPGVIRAKGVGGVNDRDGGRDILIDWLVPAKHDGRTEISEFSEGNSKEIRVIAQVKTRSKIIGKRDVQDIRDTLEHYKASAFLLIGYPRISSALVDHLDNLRNKTTSKTDWWEASEIESRLRRHPDIAARYPQLLKLLHTKNE